MRSATTRAMQQDARLLHEKSYVVAGRHLELTELARCLRVVFWFCLFYRLEVISSVALLHSQLQGVTQRALMHTLTHNRPGVMEHQRPRVMESQRPRVIEYQRPRVIELQRPRVSGSGQRTSAATGHVEFHRNKYILITGFNCN